MPIRLDMRSARSTPTRPKVPVFPTLVGADRNVAKQTACLFVGQPPTCKQGNRRALHCPDLVGREVRRGGGGRRRYKMQFRHGIIPSTFVFIYENDAKWQGSLSPCRLFSANSDKNHLMTCVTVRSMAGGYPVSIMIADCDGVAALEASARAARPFRVGRNRLRVVITG